MGIDAVDQPLEVADQVPKPLLELWPIRRTSRYLAASHRPTTRPFRSRAQCREGRCGGVFTAVAPKVEVMARTIVAKVNVVTRSVLVISRTRGSCSPRPDKN